MNDQLALFIDFENVAIWAEQAFFDLKLTSLMEYLQGRGSVVVKRAYGDWARFSRYRDDMLDNSIDLIQMYSVRAGKNRADIRLALDAFETAVNRPQIETIVIVSGDSDFGALASKLREYGRYVLGIGPRDITHALLVKSCDEFVYLETVLGEKPEPTETPTSAREDTRQLLQAALSAHGKRGELPILAARLKQTMLSMDSTFNEANLGYGQFRAWLEDNEDVVRLFFKDLQLYVAPADFAMPEDFALARKPPAAGEEKPAPPPRTNLADSYRSVFDKVIAVDLETRRDVLRDIYRELSQRPGEWTPGSLLTELQSRYESKDRPRDRKVLLKVWQMGFHQRAYEYLGSTSFSTPVRLADDIDGQTTFIRRAESKFVYAVIKADLEIDPSELAAVLLNDRTQVDYVQALLDDLERRDLIVRDGDQYRLPGRSEIPLLDDPNLEVVTHDIQTVQLPGDLGRDVEAAKRLAKSAMAKRSHDFAASARDFLMACRVQWDAVERREADASLEDLRWYAASYASVRAGELSQNQDYAAAQPYYLAFFSLVQEGTPLWDRTRKLINPLLHYYWRNVAREMDIELAYTKSPAELAVQVAAHPDPTLPQKWQEATQRLAQVNPDVLRRVANQIRLTQADAPQATQVAGQIESMLED